MRSIKRGFSLIEVVVALGILTVVFSGAAILIVQTVNLAISARERTEAILLAQKILAEEVVSIEGQCNLTGVGGEPEAGRSGGYSYTINHNETIDYGNYLNGASFIEIFVTVNWSTRVAFQQEEQRITVSQIVRR